MKTVLTVSQTFGQIDTGNPYTSIRLRQSARLNDTYTLAIDGTYFRNADDTNLEVGVALKYLF
jgi:hypothetical protein